MIKQYFNTADQQGLLALAPFLLLATSFSIALKLSALLLVLLLLQVLLLFVLRPLIPAQQRLPIMLIIGVTLVLIADLLLAAHAPMLLELVPVLLPLMILNSLVLSHSEAVFASSNAGQMWRTVARTGLIIISFFLLFGAVRTMLVELPVFASAAGCFLIVGVLFALLNALNSLTASES